MTSSMELCSLAAHQSVDWRREGMRRVVCCVRTGVWRRLGGGTRHLVAGGGRHARRSEALQRRTVPRPAEARGRRRRALEGAQAHPERDGGVGGGRGCRRWPESSSPSPESCRRARRSSPSSWLPSMHYLARMERGSRCSFRAARRTSPWLAAAGIAGGS